MFSCEICDISKNIFFTEHFWTTASESWLKSPSLNVITQFWKQNYLQKIPQPPPILLLKTNLIILSG